MKKSLKTMAEWIATILVLPAVLLYELGKRLWGPSRAFSGWSQFFGLFPGLSGIYLRRAFYRWTLSRCDTGACIGFGTVFSHPAAELGKNVYVGVFSSLGDVTLEDDVLVGSHVSIMNGAGQHGIERLDVPVRDQSGSWPRVTIGRDAWIGERTVVMADVGRHAVVGAGSVVTRPIPEFAVAVGVPARVVRLRSSRAGDAERTDFAPTVRSA